MTDQYRKIMQDNLTTLFSALPPDLEARTGARNTPDGWVLDAFGDPCRITPEEIFLGPEPVSGVLGILISLYALNAVAEAVQMEPFKAFKEFPNSMPYVGAFASHTEAVLVPRVERIRQQAESIAGSLGGHLPGKPLAGDFSMVLHPLPKIALNYVFYLADEDFPASAVCLYSNNANRFLPMDALADVGEYTSKKILDLVG